MQSAGTVHVCTFSAGTKSVVPNSGIICQRLVASWYGVNLDKWQTCLINIGAHDKLTQANSRVLSPHCPGLGDPREPRM
jgi:hypothetical protein